MIALAEMLVDPAKAAGIEVPPDPNDYDPSSYPHWYVFCEAQIGQPMPDFTVHWGNAKVVAAVSRKGIHRITLKGLEKRGFQIGYSK